MKYQVSRNEEPLKPDDLLIETVCNALIEDETIQIPDGIVEVSLVDSEEIIRLNHTYLKENGVTDVLAFEMLEEDPETDELIIGCIAANYTLAAQKAEYYCGQPGNESLDPEQYTIAEVLMYILHGLLHFAGFEDDLPEERKNMFSIAEKVIVKHGLQVVPYG